MEKVIEILSTGLNCQPKQWKNRQYFNYHTVKNAYVEIKNGNITVTVNKKGATSDIGMTLKSAGIAYSWSGLSAIIEGVQ